MNLSKTSRNAMFALLYFAQGAVLSYFTALNALYLLQFNLSMSQIGLIGTIGLIPSNCTALAAFNLWTAAYNRAAKRDQPGLKPWLITTVYELTGLNYWGPGP